MRKKQKVDHVDQGGSRDGKGEESSRETVKPSFALRLTYEKVEQEKVDHWISGSDEIREPEVVEVLKEKFEAGRVSLERGEKGLEHFQITVGCWKSRMRRSAVRKFLEEHWKLDFPVKDYCEPCLRTWASFQYCKKVESHLAGPWEWGLEKEDERSLKISDLPEMRPFQKTIVERYETPAPMFNSTIDWYTDVKGQIGKTMLSRMLILKLGFYLLDGSAQKMKFQAAKTPAPGYILDVVRSKEEHFSYEGLENISNQVFCDTFGSDQKGMVIRKGAHIVCFSNWHPIVEKITKSRWNIFQWDEKKMDFVKKQV